MDLQNKGKWNSRAFAVCTCCRNSVRDSYYVKKFPFDKFLGCLAIETQEPRTWKPNRLTKTGFS